MNIDKKNNSREKFLNFLNTKYSLGITEKNDKKKVKKQIIILIILFIVFVAIFSSSIYMIIRTTEILQNNNIQNICLNIENRFL